MTRRAARDFVSVAIVVGVVACSAPLPGDDAETSRDTVPTGASVPRAASSAPAPSRSPAGLEPREGLPPLKDGEVAACTDLCGDPPGYHRVTPGTIAPGTYQTRWFFGGYMTLELGQGWSSLEDSTAELQLFPPEESEYGLHFGLDMFPVDGGTPVPGVKTAAAFLDWLAANSKLVVTEPADTTIGDVPWLAVDVSLSDAAENEADDCPAPVCVLFIGDDQVDHHGGIAGDDVYRFYLADVEYSGSKHLFSLIVEARDSAHLDAVRPVVEDLLATLRIPASAIVE